MARSVLGKEETVVRVEILPLASIFKIADEIVELVKYSNLPHFFVFNNHTYRVETGDTPNDILGQWNAIKAEDEAKKLKLVDAISSVG